MYKQIDRGISSLLALKRGVDELADTVKVTLGPKGRPVILETAYGASILTKDGVTVAQNILLKDPVENQGAKLVRDVTSKTNDVSGDGTSTSAVLTQAIISEGVKSISGGVNGQTIKTGIDKASKAIVEALVKSSVPVTDESLVNIASISANDKEIGQVVADAMLKVGTDGALTVQDTHAVGMTTEIVDGMRFDRGHSSTSPFFTINQKDGESVLNNPLIFITDKGINSESTALEIVEKMLKDGQRDILIIAESVEGEALSLLVGGYLQGKIKACAVKAPGFADHKREILLDIAAVTGGTLISDSLAKGLDTFEIADCGTATKVIISKEETTIIGGAGKDILKERIETLKNSLETTQTEFEKERTKDRIAKLSGGVGVIKVGANSELEAKEKKHRIEDAIRATAAARESGIVAGGGIALIRAAQTADYSALSGDDLIGANILIKAIESPLKTIAENAGQDGSYIVKKVQEHTGNVGYDAMNNKLVPDMILEGIIDPTKVTRLALENAVSAASGILSSGAVVTVIKESTDKV